MSGGYFDYNQYKIDEIIQQMADLIREQKYPITQDEKECASSDETIKEFETALKYLQLASVYTQRVDWLVSGDDGEDTFHERLTEDLLLLKN